MSRDATEPVLPRHVVMARDACLMVLVGTPTLVWYGFWRFAGVSLTVAAGIALAVGCVATLIAIPLGHARKLLIALGLLVVSACTAALTGRAQDYFLPGIVVDSVYAVVLFGSVLVGRPLIGTALRAVAGRWRFQVPGSARVHSLLTLLWAVRFAAEAVVMTVLYFHGNADLLLGARFVLRAPLQIACAAVTLTVLLRAAAGQTRAEGTVPRGA
ncbi:DUF3159 domain-containing protein [Streptomyces lunaelactis]|uniref:DUF3159 domain-containing protein n=1 Tax=Streptomyces lunaelactis TaxID=1535768 RepID=UPI00158585ED|nr:DUF3159 domain-containing protein [Streptomyces lunaelactis]NUK01366.1 DUF3159 domain-containing protein [Streptomyces lunaelactis]NUK08764.1 DUF3159 domain-containing protein [Streptomyces lunaelactis]NUK15323.1 DUF3159 domain-containing protein [Streptomyces lunaelactis]NUK22520.1 DUF3159 domain-containing protein [Streptomyces lunaelactis]NUK32658.1 DUF3159 domain-containing protein [Streptomyces lunaelactis]